MSELLHRLRSDLLDGSYDLRNEAADEIERLNARIDDHKAALDRRDELISSQDSEIKRLRDELNQLNLEGV